MCVRCNSLFDREMKVYYVIQVLKQGINTKTTGPNCIQECRNTKLHLLQVYHGHGSSKWLSSKIMSVKLLVTVIIVFKGYLSTYCLFQGNCFICCDFWNSKILPQN